MPLLIYLTPWHKSLDLSVPAFQWLLTCLLLLFLWKRKAQYKGLATWAALCYLGACVISTVLALDPWSAVFGLFGTHRGGLLMTATLFLIFHLIRKDDEQPIQGSMILLGVWCAILCIYQKVGVSYFGMVPEFDGRAWGLFGSPVFSGPILAACIVAVGLPKPHQFGR